MDKYEKVRVLGKGSFGSAILIKRKDDDALFVVKDIPLGSMTKSERESARKECSVLQQLDHPNIVRYVEQFENHNHLYIVMEYCNDSDLGAKVSQCQGSGMKESTILYYFSQVCLAMEYLHSKHILHRDIKTMNVFLMKNGAVKLGDFGISTVLQNTMEVAQTVCGTPYYFSPELCRRKPYNNKSDMWSLGVLLYECASGGRHPFDGKTLNQLLHRIVKTPHAPLSSSYSYEFRNLVDWCLQKDPNRRPSIRQALAYPLVRRSLEQLEENLLLATQCKIRLKDLIDYDASVTRSIKVTCSEDISPTSGLSPGQAAAVSLSKSVAQEAPPPSPVTIKPEPNTSLNTETGSPVAHQPVGVDEVISSADHEQAVQQPAEHKAVPPSHSPEALKQIIENVSRAQNIRRRITRNEAPVNQRRNVAPANARKNIGQVKSVYRSPYAQPMRDPSRPLPRALNPIPLGSNPYKVKENPASRFVRVKLDDRPSQRLANIEPDEGSKVRQRAPQPLARGSAPAYPRKWNQQLLGLPTAVAHPKNGRGHSESELESFTSTSNVLWHAPPPRNYLVGNDHSPLRVRPHSPRTEASPIAEIDFKSLHYNRLRHPPPQRLSPINPQRASTAGGPDTPPMSGTRRIGDSQQKHSGGRRQEHEKYMEELLESTYEKPPDQNVVSVRSKSEGDSQAPSQGPTDLQLLETYSTFETISRPVPRSKPLPAPPVPAPTEKTRSPVTSLTAAVASSHSAGETVADELSEDSQHRQSTGNWSGQDGEDEPELVDVNYQIEGHRTSDDPLQVAPKFHLNALPSVDYASRGVDLQPVHLPVKGEHQPNNLHRHLNADAALYAGMARESTTLDEELYLQRQKRRSADPPDTMLPSVLETLRSTREEDAGVLSPLALLKQRQSERQGAPRSTPSSSKRHTSLDVVSIQPLAVLPLSLGSRNSLPPAEDPPKGDVNAPTKVYTEMLLYLKKLLRGEKELELEGDEEDDSDTSGENGSFSSSDHSGAGKSSAEVQNEGSVELDDPEGSPTSSPRTSVLSQPEGMASSDEIQDLTETTVTGKRTDAGSEFLAVSGVALSAAY